MLAFLLVAACGDPPCPSGSHKVPGPRCIEDDAGAGGEGEGEGDGGGEGEGEGEGNFHGQLGYGNTNNIGDNELPSDAGDVPVF